MRTCVGKCAKEEDTLVGPRLKQYAREGPYSPDVTSGGRRGPVPVASEDRREPGR